MEAVPPAEATQLLIQAGEGDRKALDDLLPVVDGKLRRLANYCLTKERRDHTLQHTALVHEAYMRLIDQKHVQWKNDNLAVIALTMAQSERQTDAE
jgi:hypothetical protein